MPAPVSLIAERTRERLERLAWHVSYHARTDTERVEVAKLCRAVHEGYVCPREAHTALSALRSEQRAA